MQPTSNNPNSLETTGDSKPAVPTFACIAYVRKQDDGTVAGRVVNLAGIEATGNAERDVLSKLVREFKSQVSKLHAEGRSIAWIDPLPPLLDGEQRRSIPMHL